METPEPLCALRVVRKTGQEFLPQNGKQLGCRLQEFWQWYASDLASNALRGVLAEFLAASALGLTSATRLEWDLCDLRTENGLRIEVKPAVYIQAWRQTKLSPLRFDIRPTKGWDAATNEYHDTAARRSDVYVFCLLKTEVQDSLDPLDVSQWDFFVLPASVFDEKTPKQKTIALEPLLMLQPMRADYHRLAKVIEKLA